MIFRHPNPHITEAATQVATNDTPTWAKVLGIVLVVGIGVMLLLCGFELERSTALMAESERRFREMHPNGMPKWTGPRYLQREAQEVTSAGVEGRYVGRHRVPMTPRRTWRPRVFVPVPATA